MGDLYLIPNEHEIEKILELAKKYNASFEYNDFFIPDVLDDEEEVHRRIQFYKGLKRDRGRDTLHGAFFDIAIYSSDKRICEVSKLRIRQSLDIAKELGIRAVIFHTNIIANFRQESYIERWILHNEAFWKEMLCEYPQLEIYIENMFDIYPDTIRRLAEKMADEKRFGICLDYAHAVLSGTDTKQWVDTLAPYIRHIHINDNDLLNDAHESVGKGNIDWKVYDKLLREHKINASVLIEVNSTSKQQESLAYMERKGLYPFNQ